MGEPLEERMMSEFVAERFPGIPTSVHLRVGWPNSVDPKQPGALEERQLKLSTLPEADLVVRTEELATIYEFKIRREQEALGKLLLYRELLLSTPGYEDLKEENVALVIVTGREDPRVTAMAAKLGILEIPYRRDWLTKALAERTGAR